jgi:hypothetical protein
MGGGGGNQYYANLEKLYGAQAAQSERLMGLSEKLTYPMYERMVSESADYGSLANKERAASQSAADSRAAFSSNLTGIQQNLQSMGIDPSDPRYAKEMGKFATASFGQGAAGMTGARERTDQMGFARMQDVTGLLAGVPSNASSALSNTAATGSNLASMYNQGQQQYGQNVAGAVRGGIDLYGFTRNNPTFFGADGGPVLKLKGGGYVQRLARGGITGAMEQITPPPPPTGSPDMSNANAAATGQGLMRGREMLGTGVEKVGSMTGNTNMTAYGQGMRLGKEAQPAVDAYSQAAAQVNSILPPTAEMAATDLALGGVGGTTGAATLAEGAGAAALEGVAGSMGAGAALGAAMPWIGGAMLVGSALGLFKDGGVVNQQPYMRGGEIDGPGGPKDDLIATEIPEGAFVMPIGVVRKLGRKALEKMNEVEDHSATKKKRNMVKVRVSDDEFIIQPDAVDRIGLAKLEKIRQDGLAYENKLGIGKP